MNKIILLLVTFLLFSCGKESKEVDKIEEVVTQQENIIKVGDTFGYNIIKNADNSFGYEIFSEGVKIIKQEHIPAVPGNNGFEKESHAKALAELVIKKLENQIMPPTVTVEEIDSIKALK